jgi:hypothetical protein
MLKIIINRNNRITTVTHADRTTEVPIYSIETALIVADGVLAIGGTIEPAELVAEAIILRALRRVREGTYMPFEVELIVEGERISITEDGDLASPFPGGFYEWRTKELF